MCLAEWLAERANLDSVFAGVEIEHGRHALAPSIKSLAEWEPVRYRTTMAK